MASARKIDREKSPNQHIQVYVRCRPANAMEKKAFSPMIVDISPDQKDVIIKEKERIAEKELTKRFPFDRVFGPNSTQVDVYRTVAFPLIDEVLMGYNCTVFAYGQTGTGKTYTMEGCKSGDLYTWDTDPCSGIIPRTFQHLFDVLALQAVEYNVRVSYLELYNEELFDLLGSLQEMPKLRLYEDSAKKGSVVIQGLTEIIVLNKDEVYNILERGAERRRVANTLMNEISSRSHTVFSITVHIKENTIEGEDLVKIGKLNLVDLAGSECIGRSGAVDKRAREAGNINQSLLTLGRVITALVEKTPHVPYRESKLTRLLQDSLGGRTKTSIIATISPAQCNSDETCSTLEYACRAKNITNKPEVNQKMTKKALIKEYTEEIERLRRDLTATREKNGIFVDAENYDTMRAMLSNQSQAIKEKLADMEALKAEKDKIMELFDRSQETISAKNAELKILNKNLEITDVKLKKTEKALHKTVFEREEQKHLVFQQVKTEKSLSSQAQKLLQVAENSTKDLAGVFAKLDRKTSVETENQRIVENLRLTTTGLIKGLESSLTDLLKTHTQQMGTLKQSFNLSLSKISEHVALQTAQLENLASLESNYCEATKEKLNIAAQDSTQHLHRLSEWNTNVKESMCNSQFLNAQGLTFNALLASNKMQLDLISTVEEHCSKVDEVSAVLTSGFSTNLMNLSSVASCLDKQVNKLQEFLETQAHDAKVKEEEEKDSFENLKKAMADTLEKALGEHTSLSKKSKEKAQNKLLNVVSSTVEDLSALKQRSTDEWQPAVSALKIFTEDNLTAISQKQIQALSGKRENISEAETLVFNLQKNNLQFEAEQQTLTTKFHSEGEQLMAVIGQSLQEKLEGVNIAIQNHCTEVGSSLAKQHTHESEHSADMISLVDQQSQEASELVQWEQECRAGLSLQLQTCLATVDHTVMEELRTDLPTGLTPQRREYMYPRYLASTYPHEQILKNFRHAQDSSSASNAVIPDSPIKDEDTSEMAPPTFQMTALEVAEDQGELSDAASEGSTKSSSSVSSKEAKENKIKLQRLPLPLKTTEKQNSKTKPKPTPTKKAPLRAPNNV